RRTEYQLREQGWEHELASRDSQIQELSDEIAQLRATLEATNQDAASQVSQVENVQQQLDALSIERDQLLAAQTEQAQKNQEWEETVATRDRRIKELEEEHVGICEMLQSVEKGAFGSTPATNSKSNWPVSAPNAINWPKHCPNSKSLSSTLVKPWPSAMGKSRC
ncbi:MAG: hypothetical protein GXP24_05605, partial [Planctomycetes bacterium]|nr:hypothetical protein [Planctomycetota bacterium]